MCFEDLIQFRLGINILLFALVIKGTNAKWARMNHWCLVQNGDAGLRVLQKVGPKKIEPPAA